MTFSSSSGSSSSSYEILPGGSFQSNTSIFLLSNICNLVPVRLDSSNYLFWRFQVESMLKAHSLFDIVDGSNKCPPKNLRDDKGNLLTETNPAYSQWIAQDQALITLINATLSKSAFSLVIGCKSSKEVWTALEKRFSSLTRSYIHELKSALHTVSKNSTESIDDYLVRIKDLVDKLATVSVTIDDEDILLYTLNGLPTEYNSFRTSIRTRSESVTLDELHALLKSEAKFIEEQSKSPSAVFNPTAMFACGSGMNSPNFRGRGRNQGQGRGFNPGRPNQGQYNQGQGRGNFFGSSNQSQTPNSQNQGQGRGNFSGSNNGNFSGNNGGFSGGGRVTCQICNKPSHGALDCYNRLNLSYQGRHPPSKLATMVVANDPSSATSTWLADSGCNSHVTPEISNLALNSNFNGEDAITVANGQGLPIVQAGCGTISTS